MLCLFSLCLGTVQLSHLRYLTSTKNPYMHASYVKRLTVLGFGYRAPLFALLPLFDGAAIFDFVKKPRSAKIDKFFYAFIVEMKGV